MSGKALLRVGSIRILSRVALSTLALLAILAPASRAQDSSDANRATAHAQIVRAEKLCSDLESSPVSKRTEKDYLAVVLAYRRVSLITPHAVEVPDALYEVGTLYRTMGDLFDEKYYQSAVDAYQFLLHDYPDNRYREQALLAVAEMEKDDLNDPALARKSFEEYLTLHPHSTGAAQAKQGLAELDRQQAQSSSRAAPPAPAPSPAATPVSKRSQQPDQDQNQDNNAADSNSAPARSDGSPAVITRIRTWNADTYTRIEIDLGAPVTYKASRISGPDRIYFDLDRAQLSYPLVHSPVEVDPGGYLKALRVAQYQTSVVRVVLEVTQVKDYSVFLLKDPERLVVDVYGPSGSEASSAPPNVEPPTPQPARHARPSQQPSEVAQTDNPPAPQSQQPSHPANSGSSPSGTTAQPDHSSPSLDMPKPEARKTHPTSQIKPPSVPMLPRDGQPSLTRALGLKVGRIVIDAGHGGHDTGTIGPTGLMEKDLCLDVALRLGKLIQQRLPGAEVIYTRDDDTFIPLEQRTAIANQAKADLFISIHANSSPDDTARGVETYYLNFTNSPDSMQVAARENATSDLGEHDLQDLLQKIARNDKIEESRDLAADIQDSLSKRMERINKAEKDRGVRRAPFVVLIGAAMPSILSEIAFISNPADEAMLKKPDTRQRVAEGLYLGVANYLQSTNSLTYNEPQPVEGPAGGSDGGPADGNERVARARNPR
jgi:N-acetylmuramoyl-L-alanine amidase